jgi:hypothetical protein
MPRFCLGTSALLTLRDDEAGADRVAQILEATERAAEGHHLSAQGSGVSSHCRLGSARSPVRDREPCCSGCVWPTPRKAP